MPMYDVHWPDLHADDRSEFRTLRALDERDAAEDVVECQERDECLYPIGEGRDTATVFVRIHASGEAWRKFMVRGEPRITYHATEETD